MEFLVRSALSALLPPADGLPGVEDCEVRSFVSKLKKDADPVFWIGTVAGASVFTATPVLTLGLPLPAFALPRRLRDRHAQKIATHRIYLLRQPVFLLKMVAGMCWVEHPDVRDHLNLPSAEPEPPTWRTC